MNIKNAIYPSLYFFKDQLETSDHETLVHYSFKDVEKGDLIFYQINSVVNVAVAFFESLFPTTSALGASVCHVGIVTKVRKDFIEIAHNFGSGNSSLLYGSLITKMPEKMLDKDRYLAFVVVSPIPKEEHPLVALKLRKLIVKVAKEFCHYDEGLKPRPSSLSRGIRTFFQLSHFSKEVKYELCTSLTDFITECPPIEAYTKEGYPQVKGLVCSEFVHKVYQTAYFYHYLPKNVFEAIKNHCPKEMHTPFVGDFDTRVCKGLPLPKNDLEYDQKKDMKFVIEKKRHEAIGHLIKNFDIYFPEKVIKKMPQIVLQNSLSFSPGRLLSAFEPLSSKVFSILPNE